MKQCNKKYRKDTVFSTDPHFEYDYGDPVETETLPPYEQLLRVSMDTKRRHGKVVTLVEGFVGSCFDLKSLCKTIKTQCGSGGSVKDGQIIIQGDMRDRIVAVLSKDGYKYKIR